MSVDGLATQHPHVVDAEDVIDGLRHFAAVLVPLAVLARPLFLRLRRQAARVLLGLLLPFAILLRELVIGNGPAVLRDESFPARLAWQARIVLEHFHRLAGRAATAVELSLAPRLDEAVAALQRLVGLKTLLDLGEKGCRVRKRGSCACARAASTRRAMTMQRARCVRTIMRVRVEPQNPSAAHSLNNTSPRPTRDAENLAQLFLQLSRSPGLRRPKGRTESARPFVSTLPKGLQSRAQAARPAGTPFATLAAAQRHLCGEGGTTHGRFAFLDRSTRSTRHDRSDPVFRAGHRRAAWRGASLHRHRPRHVRHRAERAGLRRERRSARWWASRAATAHSSGRTATKTDLGTLGSGSSASASGINEAGQVVGYSALTTPPSGSHAVLWSNGAITDLTPDVPANQGASATAINEAGQVVGNINYTTAFLWQNGARTPLGHLGGGGGAASDINDSGVVVGSSSTTR